MQEAGDLRDIIETWPRANIPASDLCAHWKGVFQQEGCGGENGKGSQLEGGQWSEGEGEKGRGCRGEMKWYPKGASS